MSNPKPCNLAEALIWRKWSLSAHVVIYYRNVQQHAYCTMCYRMYGSRAIKASSSVIECSITLQIHCHNLTWDTNWLLTTLILTLIGIANCVTFANVDALREGHMKVIQFQQCLIAKNRFMLIHLAFLKNIETLGKSYIITILFLNIADHARYILDCVILHNRGEWNTEWWSYHILVDLF